MKFIIQESRLKNLVVDKIGLDLTNKISIITHPNELPIHWDNNFFSPQQMNRILNNRGPLYLVEYDKKEYLVIPRDAEKEGKGWWVLDESGDLFHDYKFMRKLGIDIIGLGFDNLLDIFFDENETINESELTEEQSLYLRRRYEIIDDLINYVLYQRDPSDILSWNVEEFEEEVCWMIYDLLDEHGHNVDSFTTESLFDYIKQKYGDQIKTQYKKLMKRK